ncbi:acyltransferase family protein [Shimia biformata]|uniref:acyltransferase family protein n=1 Tax=Shimia biformata TaxID=1294299 RepID=UPI001950D7C9|nr:acyltransferase family protein [Shimia biformata]
MTGQGISDPRQTGHRQEIDGLRCIAVLAVVFYHFDLPGVGGGFVGVDVFFVISGFLIGGILWRELSVTGRIALGQFYLRRIRRLAPAYFVMVFACFVVGWWILLPHDLREYGKAAVAATVYLSNILFFRQTGYFDGASDEKLLLHTWSLSVEEQFYLVLPATLLLFSRFRPLGWIGAFGLISLCLSLWLTTSNHAAAFYLFPPRAWELLAGVFLAIWAQQSGFRWRIGPWASWLGLGLVLGAVVLTVPGAGFPGWQVVAPVVGTVLLIANGGDPNPVNRGLSMRGPVFVGLISYSLYLWHWPIMVFGRYVQGDAMGWTGTAALIGLSLVLATLSWRFVEQPARRAGALSGRTLLSGAVMSSALTLAGGYWLYKQDGVPTRFDASARVHIDATADFLQDFSRCQVPGDGPLAGIEICPIGPDGPPEILVWGDSHVRAVFAGLAAQAEASSVPGWVIWRAGCPPLFGIEKRESAATRAQDAACSAANRQIAAALGDIGPIARILLVGRWAYYSSGTGTGSDLENRIALNVDGVAGDQKTLFANRARETVARLRDVAPVHVLRQPPEIAPYDSRRAARALAHGRPPISAHIARSEAERRTHDSDALWRELAANGDINLLDTWPFVCDETTCRAVVDGVGQYFDNNHLTNRAALRLRHLFAEFFATPEGA